MLKNMRLYSAFLIFFFSCIISSQLKAQISFGPKLGFNTIYSETDEVTGNTFYLGSNTGVFFQYQPTRKIALETGLDYSNRKNTYLDTTTYSLLNFIRLLNIQGADSVIQQVDSIINTNVYEKVIGYSSRNYIDIPLNFIYKPTQRLDLVLGAQISFLWGVVNKEQLTQRIPILDALALDDTSQIVRSAVNSLFPGYYQPVVTTSFNNSRYATMCYAVNVAVNYNTPDGWIFGMKVSYGLNDYRTSSVGGFKNDIFLNTYIAYRFDRLVLKSKDEPSFN
jgi:hypothetical protein